jgi:hypothetical protein
MQPFIDFLYTAYAYLAAHPQQTVEGLLVFWGLANIVWAHWPKPVSPAAQKVWAGLHDALLLISTHASQPGTFTLPGIARIFVKSQDPFGEFTKTEDKPQDPPLPPATVG